jgi:peroxiredoxin
MSATVHCPECNAPLELPGAIPAGKRLQCPDCGAAFSPPAEADRAGGVKATASRPEARGAAGPDGAPRRRPRRHEDDFEHDAPPRRGGGSAAVLAAVVVIVLLVLGAGGVVVVGFSRAVAVDDQQVVPMPAMPPPAVMAGPGGAPVGVAVAPGGMVGPGMMGGGGMAAGPAGGPKVGDAAPEIDGEDLDGKAMKLSDFRGKVVVLDFWGDWCPFCKPTHTLQSNLINRMKGEPFVVLGVNSDATKEQAQLVVKNQKLAWRSWHDGGGNLGGPITAKYGVTAIPTAFVIDKKGVVQLRLEGALLTEFNLDQSVDRLLAAGENRPGNAPPRWAAPSSAYSHLADEVAVGPYLIRAPEGYALEKLAPEPKHETYRWKGPAGPDGTSPVFEVSLEPAPPADRKLEDILEKDVAAVPRKGLMGWTCTAAERSEVKGLVFARTKWTITDSPFKLRASGYVYAAVDGDTLVRISCHAVAPAGAGTLDAAPLTFRRAPAK